MASKIIGWTLIVGTLFMLCIGGCGMAGYAVYSSRSANRPDQPSQPVSGEAAYWNALADRIKDSPDNYQNTDVVYWAAMQLKESNLVSSIDRIDRYKSKMETITDANRDEVIRAVRGGE